jgi:hypothetical protein
MSEHIAVLTMKEETMKKSTCQLVIGAAVAGMISAGGLNLLSSVAHADDPGRCIKDGGNACKGKSACKTAKNECAGTNGCKGQGFANVKTSQASCVKMSKKNSKVHWMGVGAAAATNPKT